MARIATGSDLVPTESDTAAHTQETKQAVGYVSRAEATDATYTALGFMCGLEIHQQLLTDKKLFCHCPAGVFHSFEDYNAEVIRHMRPTLSEMGGYDGTALMEKRTRKRIFYRINNRTACTYDIDDTPPFKLNSEAMRIAVEISLLLKLSVVGELHIIRKQYLDGSIPAGFQRTGIIGIEGEIPVGDKRIKIIQLSIEEDSCREVSDIGHDRVYSTDRLGMPLIETVTYPEMLTPDESAAAAEYLRLLVRSTGKVRVGLGAARQDVNVSITGGTRVEIKGVAHIKWIPELTHNEAFRQKALLVIADELKERIADPEQWQPTSRKLSGQETFLSEAVQSTLQQMNVSAVAMNLPNFTGLLSHFTQPGKVFGDELSDRLKVVACLERPNCFHSEQPLAVHGCDFAALAIEMKAKSTDSQIIIIGPEDDMATAIETVDERCRLAFVGVPNETRKAIPDGTTIFERVLPGPDRMYPDTDTAPISIAASLVKEAASCLPTEVHEQIELLNRWRLPADTHAYIIRQQLIPKIIDLAESCEWDERFLGCFFAHTVKGLRRRHGQKEQPTWDKIRQLCHFVKTQSADRRWIKEFSRQLFRKPQAPLESLWQELASSRNETDELSTIASQLRHDCESKCTSDLPGAVERWLLGRLKTTAPLTSDWAELMTLARTGEANV